MPESTLIPQPKWDGTFSPAQFVEPIAAACTLEKYPRGSSGYWKSETKVSTADGTYIGSVSRFSDGSGWWATSPLTRGPNNVPMSKGTKTRKAAVEFLVATAAGVRWH